jgi:hypothetical protein
MYLKVHPRTGRRFAVHLNPGESAWAPESDEHKALKERIARAATAAGFEATIEDRPAHGRRRTDVLVYGDDILLGCEPQLSPISVTSVRRRSAVAEADGITPLWTTTDVRASVIDRAPWARIDRMEWRDYLEPSRDLPVRGGVRALTAIRCTRMTVCNDKKLARACTGWNHQWEPRQLPRFDDLITRAASTDLKPVKQQISKARAYWFWAPATDLANVRAPEPAVAATLSLGPVVTVDTPDEQVDDRLLDEECRYGQEPEHRSRITPRESDAVITVDSVPLVDGVVLIKPAPTVEMALAVDRRPRIVLDWSHSSHYLKGDRPPCRLCGKPTFLADDDGRPCHKICAERELENRM